MTYNNHIPINTLYEMKEDFLNRMKTANKIEINPNDPFDIKAYFITIHGKPRKSPMMYQFLNGNEYQYNLLRDKGIIK